MPVITGTYGDDVLVGTDGDDTFYGRAGTNIMRSGRGDDRFVWTLSDNVSDIDGGEGFDTLDLSAYRFSDFTFGPRLFVEDQDEAGTIHLISQTYARLSGIIRTEIGVIRGVEQIFLGAGTVVDLSSFSSDLSIVSTLNELVYSGAHDVSTGTGDDTIIMGAYADVVRPGGGDNIVRGGDGDDFVYLNLSRSGSVLTIDGDWLRIETGGVVNRLQGVEHVVFNDGTIDLTGDTRIAPISNTRVVGHQGDNLLNGTSGADTLIGLGGVDILEGLDGADWLLGGAAGDLLIGGAGDDVIDGGSGIDAAGYVGVFRQYDLSPGAVAGEGVDTLSSIEELRFTDGTWVEDVGNSTMLQAVRMFHAVYGEDGDVAVLARWVANRSSTSPLQMANDALLSHAIDYALSPVQFVDLMYRNVLDRQPAPEEAAVWLAALATTNRAWVLAAFSESAEHRALMGEPTSGPMWVPRESALTIARMYDATFDRLPDAAGLLNWVNAYEGGQSVVSIAGAFASSQEFQIRYGALSNSQFVQQMYRFCLDREAEPEGLAVWTAALNGGMSRAEVLMHFAESAEHIALTAPLWEGGVRTQETEAAMAEPVKAEAMAAIDAGITTAWPDHHGLDADHLGGPIPVDPDALLG